MRINNKFSKYCVYGLGMFIVTVSLILTFKMILNKNNARISFNQINDANICIDLFNIEKTKKNIAKTYFSNQNPIQFSSYGFHKNYPNIYSMYWTLKIAKCMNYNIEGLDIDAYKQFIMTNTDTDNEYPDILKIECEVGICKMLGIEIDRQKTSNYLSILNDHYDSGMFFAEDRNEDLTSKLSTTKQIINIYNDLNVTIDHKNEIIAKLIELYNDDYNFSAQSIIQSLNTGGIIIETLNNLGFKSNNIKTIKDRTNWMDYINNNISFSLDNKDIRSILYYKIVLNANDFFSNEYNVPKTALDDIVKSGEIYNGVNFIEPQVFYYVTKIYIRFNYDYYFKNQLINYIDDLKACDFNKLIIVEENIQDNYFGLLLAEKFNFKYDRNRMKDYLKQVFLRNIEENSNISSYEKLQNEYYIILSYRTLGMDMNEKNKELIINSLYDYMKGLDEKSFNKRSENLRSYEMCFELIRMLNGSIPDNFKSDAIDFINTITSNDDIYNNIDMCSLYNIIDYIDYRNHNSEIIIKKIAEGLKKLYVKGGYKSKTQTEYPNIISTYKALKFKKENNLLDINEINEINEINNYVKQYLEEESPFGYKQDKGMNLNILYHGFLIRTMINDSSLIKGHMKGI